MDSESLFMSLMVVFMTIGFMAGYLFAHSFAEDDDE